MYYDDFVVGDKYSHRPGRTVTEADCYWLTMLHGNPHPLHFDQNYAEDTEFSRVVVSSLFTFPLIHAMTVASTSANAVANLGWKEIKLHAPVFVGDTLYAETIILSKRDSKSRAGFGIVSVATTGLKATGDIVMTFERSFLIRNKQVVSDNEK
ncbi:dehydratase [Pseudomonas syringae pv. theae ICMP 3923]|nr:MULTISPECIES: MaoC family dehydratase [Pseudomonas syringae group]EFW83248.1 dehydratase [Pseudomonas savastanoi pv. glycinea str. race 4]EPM73063.1 dehydratase [Pseudomonas syringae pv. theae ICMP 3923]KPX10531.1 Dehydratase [Pseudomonas syringae pv. cunninghamiae]KPZ30544.1 hypothetical protein AN901_204998 [Pseudomonas syringae pv. theae]RMV20244.1 hypothetical protein ALP17_200018 [Pseudomonas savastanoi]